MNSVFNYYMNYRCPTINYFVQGRSKYGVRERRFVRDGAQTYINHPDTDACDSSRGSRELGFMELHSKRRGKKQRTGIKFISRCFNLGEFSRSAHIFYCAGLLRTQSITYSTEIMLLIDTVQTILCGYRNPIWDGTGTVFFCSSFIYSVAPCFDTLALMLAMIRDCVWMLNRNVLRHSVPGFGPIFKVNHYLLWMD